MRISIIDELSHDEIVADEIHCQKINIANIFHVIHIMGQNLWQRYKWCREVICLNKEPDGFEAVKSIPKLPDFNVGSMVITPGEHVRNLGVIMNTQFTMEPHINKIMQIAFLKIRQISYYGKILTPSAAKTLIHAYMTSRLDCCNGFCMVYQQILLPNCRASWIPLLDWLQNPEIWAYNTSHDRSTLATNPVQDSI